MEPLNLTPPGLGTGLSRPGPRAEPLDLAARRLGWLDRRQAVLAQNIANADTPEFRPRDLTPFARMLAGTMQPPLARTAPNHLHAGGRARDGGREDRSVAEAAPDGNAVSLDREAVRIAETDTAHALAMQVHRSFTGMFRLALGRQG
ncbi:flagellar basal body rod protein FlgB [Falsiroseomonas sp. E2-1-a20]|uniref:flagellar basal body rod protein FlgB n=1 Tax=Falsiroseomonas sp. E2-1-a20 TaxID=3239300 RepID=UPI003F365723